MDATSARHAEERTGVLLLMRTERAAAGKKAERGSVSEILMRRRSEGRRDVSLAEEFMPMCALKKKKSVCCFLLTLD